MADIPLTTTQATKTDSKAAHLSEAEQERLSHLVLRRQFTLSIGVALIFSVILFGMPLVNWLLPALANAPVGGFTLTWLVLAVLFYPLTWLLSGYFIRSSDRIERELTVQHRADAERKQTEDIR